MSNSNVHNNNLIFYHYAISIAFQDMAKDEIIYSSARNTKVIFLFSVFKKKKLM